MVPALRYLLLPGLLLPQQSRPPSAAEQQKLVKEYLKLDERSEEGSERMGQILRRLDAVPPLSASKARDWAKRILKLARKGRKLEKKAGRHWFWESKKRGKRERRGLYIVGGKTKKPEGLLIGMHGGGRGAGDAGSSHGAYSSAASKLGWVGIFPEVLEKTEHGWTDSGTEEFVLDLVTAALRTWKIDPNRVFFAGHSMGGYGTWTLGAHHADRVAGLAPSAGAPTPVFAQGGGKVVDIIEGVIPSLRNVPIVVYQSTDDPRVPPEPNQVAVKKLEEASARWGGYEHEYWEVTGRGHAPPPGGTRAHLAKIAGRRRQDRPAKIVWQPVLAWKRQFYWLYWSAPVKNAIVVAELDRERNRIRVDCDQDPAGLSVLLDGRLVDMQEDVVIQAGDREVYRGVPERRLYVILMTAAGCDPGRVFEARIPLGE